MRRQLNMHHLRSHLNASDIDMIRRSTFAGDSGGGNNDTSSPSYQMHSEKIFHNYQTPKKYVIFYSLTRLSLDYKNRFRLTSKKHDFLTISENLS